MIVYVTDMRDFLIDGRLPLDVPAAAWRFAAYLGEIVEVATAHVAGDPVTTPLPCRRRPGHRSCPGRLQVRRLDVPAEIAWRCPSCGEEGVIRSWAGSPWDLSPARTPRPDDRVILLAEREYRTLRDLKVLDRDAKRQVAGAWMNELGVHLVADPDELEHLIGFVAADANHELDRPRAARLDELFGLLESHLGIVQRIERPTS